MDEHWQIHRLEMPIIRKGWKRKFDCKMGPSGDEWVMHHGAGSMGLHRQDAGRAPPQHSRSHARYHSCCSVLLTLSTFPHRLDRLPIPIFSLIYHGRRIAPQHARARGQRLPTAGGWSRWQADPQHLPEPAEAVSRCQAVQGTESD